MVVGLSSVCAVRTPVLTLYECVWDVPWGQEAGSRVTHVLLSRRERTMTVILKSFRFMYIFLFFESGAY